MGNDMVFPKDFFALNANPGSKAYGPFSQVFKQKGI